MGKEEVESFVHLLGFVLFFFSWSFSVEAAKGCKRRWGRMYSKIRSLP